MESGQTVHPGYWHYWATCSSLSSSHPGYWYYWYPYPSYGQFLPDSHDDIEGGGVMIIPVEEAHMTTVRGHGVA